MIGQIKYQLYTLLGTKEIVVSYDIDLKGSFARCAIRVEGEGDKPDELETEETMQEIVELCMEDMKTKATEPEDYKRVLPDSLWGAN